MEKLTFAPVKKNAFKKRTAPGKFAEVRRKISTDELKQMACRQQDNLEALEMGIRLLGLLSPLEEMRISKVDVFSQRAEASTSEEG